MKNTGLYLWEIRHYLAWFTSFIKLNNNAGYTDANKYAESFLIPIFNEIFEEEFERLEYVQSNYLALDIGSKDKSKSFQITSTKSFEKLKNTLSKFISNRLFEKYSELYHLVIDEDYKISKNNKEINKIIDTELQKLNLSNIPTINFKKEENFWNISTLEKKIEEKCDVHKLKRIRDHFESEYGKVISLPTFNDILIPYQIAFEKQLKPSTINLPYQFDNSFFGREKCFEELTEFINSKEHSILSVVGDGGYGKTRLCIEFFKRFVDKSTNTEAFVLNEGAFHCFDFTEQIRTDKQVIILLDDAHKRSNIVYDVVGIANRLKNVKLIMTVRKSLYNDLLKNISTHNLNIPKIPLDRLTYNETRALFKSQLRNISTQNLISLVERSRGVPIVILGMCQLIIGGKYFYELSEEENFKHFVLTLRDQVIDEICNRHYIDKGKIHKTIQLIALFSPVHNIDNELKTIAQINNISYEDCILIVEYLAETEFIHKSFDIYIKPDPYKDVVLLDTIPRIKTLLQHPDIGIFNDRIVINLVQIEHVEGLNIDVNQIIIDFILNMEGDNLESLGDISQLEKNLTTLISFTYKKPNVVIKALELILRVYKRKQEFWERVAINGEITYQFRSIHTKIDTIFSIISLNIYSENDLNKLFELICEYIKLRNDFSIIKTVFEYREYDFIEFGYNHYGCTRQDFLLKIISKIINSNSINSFEERLCTESLKTLLNVELQLESSFERFTKKVHFGRTILPSNTIVEKIRIESIESLIQLYKKIHLTTFKQELYKILLEILRYIEAPFTNEKEFNLSVDFERVYNFFLDLIDNHPTVYERSKLLKQLRLPREPKEKYQIHFKQLLDKVTTSNSQKDALTLLLIEDYFYVIDTFDEKLNEIIINYKSTDNLYEDIVDIWTQIKALDETHFDKLIEFFIKEYPSKAKELFDYVFLNNKLLVCDFSMLISANYKDEAYFYHKIEQVWEINSELSQIKVIALLTFKRRNDYKIFKIKDFEYFETVIQIKNVNCIRILSLYLAPYLFVDTDYTLNLITIILQYHLNHQVNDDIISNLIDSIFENKIITEKFKVRIKEFVLEKTIPINLNIRNIDQLHIFLDDNFGFNTLKNYLLNKVLYFSDSNSYRFLYTNYTYKNPNKSEEQKIRDFLIMLEWYTTLENKPSYNEIALITFFIPDKNFNKELREELKILVQINTNNLKYLICLAEALDIFEDKNEELLSLLIEIANEIIHLENYNIEMLHSVFGKTFIYNSGVKSKIGDGAFNEDLNKKLVLNSVLNKYNMENDVRNILSAVLKIVEQDIKNEEERSNYKEEW